MKEIVTNKVRVKRFRPGLFTIKTLPELLGYKPKKGEYWKPTKQTKYLDRYLKRLNAKTLVVEEQYVDRHYMAEYKSFYSTCLIPPSNKCMRIHVFKRGFGLPYLISALPLVNGQKNNFEKTLQDNYLGYIVIRPVSDAIIGRTMLKPLSDNPDREINALFTQEIHLLGIKLEVEGLPFQQQDQRVGACGTTAIWSALSKVARTDGARAPDPSKITEAALHSVIPYGLSYPPGLTDDQICESIRTLGYLPLLIDISSLSFNDFKRHLASYLISGIPVIMCLSYKEDEDGHAITCCGILQNPVKDETIKRKRDRLTNWEKLYFHDDRLGPYAMGYIYEKDTVAYLKIPWKDNGESIEDLRTDYMIVPLYPKIRISAEILWEFGLAWLDHISWQSPKAKDGLSVEYYFKRSGDAATDVRELTIIDEHKFDFLNTILLSRYVGIIDIFYHEELMIRFFMDTTNVIPSPIEYLSTYQISGVILHRELANTPYIKYIQYFKTLGIPVAYK